MHAEDPEAVALSWSTPATLDAHGADGYGYGLPQNKQRVWWVIDRGQEQDDVGREIEERQQ
jgi:hypothetical protein